MSGVLTETDITNDPRPFISIATGGGGSGTPSSTVSDETTWGISPNAGANANYSRGDHTHGSPAVPSGSGDFSGPSGAVPNNFVEFDGATGKLGKDSGKAASDFAAAIHNHAASDIVSGTLDQARLGSGSGGAGAKVLHDDQTWQNASAGSGDVIQDGAVTIGHLTTWSADHHIEDGGVIPSGSGTYKNIWSPLCPPTSPNAKDDEFIPGALDGSKWQTWDPGSAILAVANDARGLKVSPSLSNLQRLAGIVRASPSTDFTIWSKLQITGGNAQVYWSLLIGEDLITYPSTGYLYTAGIWITGIGMDWRVGYWTDYNNHWDHTLWSTSIGFPSTSMFVRARVTSTDISYDFSPDGVGWYLTGTEALALTPATIGLAFMNYDCTSLQPEFYAPFFRVTASADFNQIMPGNSIQSLLA
jgi:hypothetical protein